MTLYKCCLLNWDKRSWEDNDGTELILNGGLKEWIEVALIKITVV